MSSAQFAAWESARASSHVTIWKKVKGDRIVSLNSSLYHGDLASHVYAHLHGFSAISVGSHGEIMTNPYSDCPLRPRPCYSSEPSESITSLLPDFLSTR